MLIDPKKYESIRKQEQVKLLYEGVWFSIIGTIIIALSFKYASYKQIADSTVINHWAMLVIVVALIRGLDASLYFRTPTKKVNYDHFLIRSALLSTLAALAWALLLWHSYFLGPVEFELLILLIAIGVCSFATTSLSYHLGIVIVFLCLIMLPIEVLVLWEKTPFRSFIAFLIPIYLFFQITIARRNNKNYFDNIRLKIESNQKESNLKNMQYAMDQHTIVSTTDIKGNINYANDKFLELSQYSVEELIGKHHHIVKSYQHPPFFYRHIHEVVSSGNVWRGEITNKAKDGSIYWVDATVVPYLDENKQPYQFASIMTDITEAKLLEQKNNQIRDDALIRAEVSQILQEQKSLKQRIKTALEAICNLNDLQLYRKGLVYLQTTDNSYLELYASQGHLSSSLIEKEHQIELGDGIIGKAASTGNLMICNDVTTDSCHVMRLENIKHHGSYTVPLYHDGKILGVLFLYTRLNPSRDQDRKDVLNFIGGILGLAIANEQVRKNLNQARKYAEDMARSKSDFLANMSHEIRTPLNGVLGMLDLLQKSNLNKKSGGYVDIAQSSANMLLNVINDVLDISKIESGKLHIEKVNFELRKTVEDIADLFAKQAQQKDIELSVYVSPKLEHIYKGDVFRLQQILNNLISNAIKFTHEGEVSIKVSTTEKSDTIPRLRFEIIDSGIGISPDQQALLFNAFIQADSSTSRKYGGSGLGLSISKSLIEIMDGEIGLISDLNEGSTFWFELPFEIISRNEIYQTSMENLNILTIDDNKTNCFIISKYMESWGADIVCITNPVEGLAQLREAYQQGSPFDILLLDMSMPGMTGQDVATQIRSDPNFDNLKIILLSSMSLVEEMNEENHFNLLLNKPIRRSLLHDAIISVQNTNQVAQDIAPVEVEPINNLTLIGKVLFVDDNLVNQHVGREMLSQFKLDFEVVSDGKMALDARKSGDFDLILLDCQMPVMDGFEATRQIRLFETETNTNKITIVALTANAMQGDREKCLNVGMDDYLAKPYTLSKLFGTLAQWLPASTNNSNVVSSIPPTNFEKSHTLHTASKHTVEIIDEYQFQETRKIMGDNFDLIINSFIESATNNIYEMKVKREENDLVQVKNAIHSLKSSSGSLGLQRLYEFCKVTEEKYRMNIEDFSQIDEDIVEIERLYNESLSAIEMYHVEQDA